MTGNKLRRYFRHGTLTQLGTFDAVARLRSFTRAADELCLAQPTVSVHIQKLTECVGLPLIEQAGKQIRLTDAGRELHASCADIFAALAQLEFKLENLRSSRRERQHVAIAQSHAEATRHQ